MAPFELRLRSFWKKIRTGQWPFWLSLASLLLVVVDLGFSHDSAWKKVIHWVYLVVLSVVAIPLAARYFTKKDRPARQALWFDIFLIVLVLLTLSGQTGWAIAHVMASRPWLAFVLLIVFFRELSIIDFGFKRRYVNPAQLFIASFMGIIVLGTLLLLLPNATHEGISVVDALFTSTSAVCVTGLIVVDTGSYFTTFGQSVIILLIQAGGIGIMTFTSYFSYFFRGSSSLEHQLILSEMTNSDRVGEVFGTLKKIIQLTFLIEAVGLVFIYASLDNGLLPAFSERAFFAVFHAVSAFCNAGFSTLELGLYETGYRFNYLLQLTLAFLFIIGGIGFPIVFNFIKYLRHVVIHRLLRSESNYAPWILTINTRIVLATTAILLAVGTGLFFILEYHNTMAEHRGLGKLVTAFFGAATPRTAGFNTVDMTALTFPTLMVIFFLMWVGASPGSTGGGIKTTTLAIGTLNYISLARGKDRIETFGREVTSQSVRRAFAFISLSLIAIGGAVFLLSLTDGEKPLLHLAFECFSAYSTVGLSIGITAGLSTGGKLVIIGTMFVGRVSLLTVLVAVFRKVKYMNYRYPSEDISIN